MRSQLRFIMHPDDERDFVAHILSDDRVFLIDEHSNDPAGPPLLRSIEPVASGLCSIVLRPAGGGANHTGAASGKIQFSRSQIVGPLITEGRIAIGTIAGSEEAAWVERQYKTLSKFIKARYTNSILRWYNPDLPSGPASPGVRQIPASRTLRSGSGHRCAAGLPKTRSGASSNIGATAPWRFWSRSPHVECVAQWSIRTPRVRWPARSSADLTPREPDTYHFGADTNIGFAASPVEPSTDLENLLTK